MKEEEKEWEEREKRTNGKGTTSVVPSAAPWDIRVQPLRVAITAYLSGSSRGIIRHQAARMISCPSPNSQTSADSRGRLSPHDFWFS